MGVTFLRNGIDFILNSSRGNHIWGISGTKNKQRKKMEAHESEPVLVFIE